jgi:hypothetical protein
MTYRLRRVTVDSLEEFQREAAAALGGALSTGETLFLDFGPGLFVDFEDTDDLAARWMPPLDAHAWGVSWVGRGGRLKSCQLRHYSAGDAASIKNYRDCAL